MAIDSLGGRALLDVLWKMAEAKREKILSSLVAGVFDRHHLGDTIKGTAIDTLERPRPRQRPRQGELEKQNAILKIALKILTLFDV